MGKKRRTSAEFFDDAEENGFGSIENSSVNGDKVNKPIEPGTKLNYDRMLNLWDEYERRNPGATPYDLRTAKHFMEGYVRGCKARKSAVSRYTIEQRWVEFGAGWQQRSHNEKLPSAVTESVRYYIQRMPLSTERREPHYITVPHFVNLVNHMWRKDWHQYKHGRTLVQDQAAYDICIYTTSRIGEIFESNMRRGSGRGLLYKEIVFVVFKNEKGEAEIAVRATRDAKGFTNTPHKRPRHGMYEDMEPLFANPVLPFLAIALADHAFQDYHSFEEIEAIPPPVDGSLHHLRIKKELHEVPFFQIVSADGPTGTIQSAVSFANRTVGLGHRTGYQENIRCHDFRREALVKADDNGYSADERMKFGGHSNRDTFFGSYMPQISTVDGQSSYWGRQRRTVHLEAFRGLSLHYHPQMLQSLPAKVEADLRQRDDFVALSREIECLGERIRSLEAHESPQDRTHREELYFQKRQMMSEELSKWQAVQSHKITANSENEAPSVASLPTFFSRIRWLDPPRDELASLLFLNVPLRSPEGRKALQCMITLCQENPQVAYRPSVRPHNGRCPVSSCAVEMESIHVDRRWDHVYKCYKADLERTHGFAQLCFQCDEWVTTKPRWREHCHRHLEDLETLPVQFNPVTFRRTPATKGQCIFCIFNEDAPPTKRFHQYPTKQSWMVHLRGHFLELEEKEDSDEGLEPKAVLCPDPRCVLYLDSVLSLQYHCQDVHCTYRIKDRPVKRLRRANRSRANSESDFIPFTGPKPQSELPDSRSQFSSNESPDSLSSMGERAWSGPASPFDTPASSLSDDPLLFIDPRLLEPGSGPQDLSPKLNRER